MTGWVKFYRGMMESEIWSNPFTLRLYLYLSGRAVQKEFMIISGIKVKRGQYLRAYSLLSDDLMYVDNGNVRIPSKSTIKRHVDRLVEHGYLKTEDTYYGTLFTVIELDDDFFYPSSGVTEEEPNENSSETQTEQQEECKKGREDREEEGEEKIELPPRQDGQSKIEKVTNQFLQLRNAGFNISPKEQSAIEKICGLKVEGETLISCMKEIDRDYRKRNDGESIRTFTYYEKALMQRIRKGIKTSVTESYTARRVRETDELLAKIEEWKREGEERLAKGIKRSRPSFNPA
ncbi:DNA helicase [Bacillus salacetis]|uniref:DNA helicase n=1 Tax=Bacillus salacetis TaxID=2315464 RepID=A0A3A1QSZ7_9BACI|nr:DNA helicase [Bacillus salacetis]RIW30724.1 DNA helicase [Bacillus salacetis]